MGLFTPTHGMYMAVLALYIMAWIILLAGISAVQHTCYHNIDNFVQYESSSLLANTVGKRCNRLFRFPWFVVWLCTLPLFLEAGALLAMVMKRHNSSRRSTVGKAAALLAVIATLCILLANEFYNMLEAGGLVQSVGSTLPMSASSQMKARFRTTLAGFALVAAFALALLFLAPWCGDHDYDDTRSVTTTQSEKPRTAVPTGGTTTTTTAAPAHVIV